MSSKSGTPTLANGRAARPSPGPPSASRRAAAASAIFDGGAAAMDSGSSRPGKHGASVAAGAVEACTPVLPPSGIPLATLLRLGVVASSHHDHHLALPSSTNSSSSGSGESTAEELHALEQALQSVRDAADTRARDAARRRERVLAASSSSSSRRPTHSAPHSSSSLRRKNSPTASSTTIREKASSSRPPTPLNASTLGTNNAINNAIPPRGVKRSRAQDSASDSSLSPQSVTSISSFEPTNSQNAPRPSSSRHASPTVSTSTVGSNAGLGLTSAKLSRTASAAQSKEGSVPPPHSATPSLPSSAASSVKDAKPLAIPGMGAPMPALPGFTKKKKLERQASPAPSPRQFSPTNEQPPTPSSSRLPPPPSSLPPRPASLPPKPSMAYVPPTSSSLHRREPSATGSTSSRTEANDRDRDRQREKDRSNATNSVGRDSYQQPPHTERERDRRERSSSKGKESDRDGNTYETTAASMQDSKVSQRGTSVTFPPSNGTLSESPAASRPPEPSPRPPEDEPPPPPPLPPPAAEEEDKSKDLSAPVIAVENATPTPEPESMIPRASTNNDSAESRAATPVAASTVTEEASAPTEKPTSQTQQSRPRKTLPPSSSSAIPTAPASPAISPRPAITAASAIPPSAIPANVTGTPSRPNTPLGRKKLPASVTAAASRRASPAPNAGRDGTPSGTTGIEARPPTSTSSSSGQKQPQEGGKTSAGGGDAEALAALEAKQKRKEEKRKRKLAALTSGGSSATPAASDSSPKTNGQIQLSNGSPAIKINGISPSSMRIDSMHPTKMRRVDSATSIDSNDKGGLKVKLNGITLNRPKSPSEANQPPVKKGPSIPGVADDFTPPTRALVPAPPAIHLPAPTPSKQSEINENFDNAKPSTQVPYTTFANWVNDFFRSFGEDDLAFLAPKPEDPGVYDIPPLGPHYQDTWAAMDAELAGEQVEGPPPSTALVPPALKRFKSQNITTAALTTENIYLGPLGERLISAFKDTKDIRGIMEDLFSAQEEMHADKSNMDIATVLDATNSVPGISIAPHTQAAEAGFNTQTSPQLVNPAMFNDPNALSATPSIKEMDALDFESRLTRELSFLGVIPLPTRIAPPVTKPSKKAAESNTTQFDLSSSVDWSSRADDEISTALRACQRQLRKQVELNDKRKERLAAIVRQRIAYQEYEHLRDGLEAVIEGAWAKRQRAAQRKAQKDRKEKDKKGEREKDRDKLEAASLAQSIAALNTPQPLSASLVAALTKRRNLVDSVQPLFPPNAYILPTESIYQGLEHEVTQEAQ